MSAIHCQRCGEEEDLRGRSSGGTIEITCNRCGHSWARDTEPRCAKCGGTDLRGFKDPLVQRARGTAYSVVGEKTVYLCTGCDADEIAARLPTSEADRRPREDPWK